MKNSKLTLPLSMTATLAFIITCGVSCTQKSAPPEGNGTLPAPEPQPANNGTSSRAVSPTNNITVTAVASTGPATRDTAATIATPPPAPALVPTSLPTTKPIAVEMPATTPKAPKDFYSRDFATQSGSASGISTSENYYFHFRAGYQHINYHDNNDTYYVGVKFYAHGDDLRVRAGKNAWLVPDASAEISHQYLPKSDGSPNPGTGEGMQFRADFFWPWMHWDTQVMARSNSVCPFRRPLELGLGPVADVGFDQLFDGSPARLARYAGVRLNLNRVGFIEYTGGGTDGLPGTRQQMVAELPICASRDGEVRYVLHGEWNHAGGYQSDVLSGGLFLEMPFSIFANPKKWTDLIPFLGK